MRASTTLGRGQYTVKQIADPDSVCIKEGKLLNKTINAIEIRECNGLLGVLGVAAWP